MKRVFFGLILVFFDIELHITVKTGLLPDFLGYILILSGLCQLAPHGVWFARGRLPAMLLAVWSAVQYAAAVCGDPQYAIAPVRVLWELAEVPFLLLYLFLLLAIAYGMTELEMETGGGEMRTSRLTFLWKAGAVLRLLALAFSRAAPEVSVLFTAGAFAACICYLVYFHTAWKAYERLTG